MGRSGEHLEGIFEGIPGLLERNGRSDGDCELIARIRRECQACSQDEVSLCRLMRSSVRRLLDHTGALVQLEADQAAGRIFGFDIAPRLVRALRLAAHVVDGGSISFQAGLHGPLILHADSLHAFSLRPRLRPLAVGHMALHGHFDPEHESRSLFAFIGIQSASTERLQLALEAIVPSLHHVIFGLHQSWRPPALALTRTERVVCRLLLDGASNKEIARLRGKSDATIRNQLHTIFVKLRVTTRVAAAAKLREYRAMLYDGYRDSKGALIEHLYY